MTRPPVYLPPEPARRVNLEGFLLAFGLAGLVILCAGRLLAVLVAVGLMASALFALGDLAARLTS